MCYQCWIIIKWHDVFCFMKILRLLIEKQRRDIIVDAAFLLYLDNGIVYSSFSSENAFAAATKAVKSLCGFNTVLCNSG